jgi:hypothetical protein
MKNIRMLKSAVAMAALIVLTTGAAQACMPGMFGGSAQANSCQPKATGQSSCQSQGDAQGCAMINPGLLDPAMIQAMANMASGGMQIASTVVQSLFGEPQR